MEKKKRFSPLKFLLTVICILAIVVSVAINVAFMQSSVPKIYDRYIYVVEEPNPLQGDITTGAALIAKDATNISVVSGDIVLCYPADNPSVISLRSINAILESEDGTESYYTRDSIHEDNLDSISKDKIIAVCTGYPESLELGKLITFSRDFKGIIAEFIIPCFILIILLISGMIASRKTDDDEDENYDFYEYDEEEKEKEKKTSKKNAHVKPDSPLYDPASEIHPSDESNRKQMSIAENFSQKKVDPDSPYQKEKERTMQFKAQRSDVSNTGKINTVQNPEPAPTFKNTETDKKDPTIKIPETSSNNAPKSHVNEKVPVSENNPEITGVISKSQVEEMSREATPRQPVKPVEPRKNSTPDISDILSKTENQKKKKAVSNLSVDELLQMIADEEKKL